ncbi:SMP-30/gluconolactonase/LRE family protein [Flagellimonas pacifica]|uniref:Sugar lactone lactonase YvrE n=1 Tax=Flagellimonas pacifica TaxID=1247520 RepID=A0A285MX41_9FLAO|nr:SMP-30/gluconolactonase/LRE family protein [Allomuricauda parva]SNZ01745.1 Sugar lactone lactonase YvrE [Allomuricauda parva]
MSNIDTLCTERFSCGEGPLWVPKTRELYWTDSDGKSIRCYSDKLGTWKEISNGIHASSLVLHSDGGLVYGSKTGFYHLDESMNIRSIAEQFENRPITNINDIIADPVGRVYGGQECFDPDGDYETGNLYRIDLDGKVSVIEDGLHLSNGMGFSPDLAFFYLVDTIARNIYVYDFDEKKGSISNKKVLATLKRSEGLPDGLTVDSDGFVWVAMFLGSGLIRFDPDGKIERKIDLECAQPTSLTFGGKDLNEIFVTSASMYWETSLAPENHDYNKPRGGELYRIKQEVIGKVEYLAKI